MSRRLISFEALAGLIRAQMALIPDCQGCVCGTVKWRRADGDGCNWIISRLEGSQSLSCLDGLVPMLNSLRAAFNVPEPIARLSRAPRAGTAQRAVPVRHTATDRSAEMTEELLRAARDAARESRLLLRHHQRTLPQTVQQCRKAERALAASLRLLGRDALVDTAIAARCD